MRVQVKLFASLREAAGRRELELECQDGARVADVMRLLGEQYPRLRGLDASRVAVNLEYVGPEFGLREGDELAIIPPVSGGAGARRRSETSSSGRNGGHDVQDRRTAD